MHGNVWEWTKDCYRETLDGQPGTGAPYTQGDCSRRVVRGGSWYEPPQYLRSAGRSGNGSSSRGNLLGFRVARTGNPFSFYG